MLQEFFPQANGATYNEDSHGCWAEFSMTGPNDNTAYHTCLFPGDMSLCTFEVGDGTGETGTEEHLGDANSESGETFVTKSDHRPFSLTRVPVLCISCAPT